MIYTNKLNLPNSIINSVVEKNPPVDNRYSVTELLKSIREIKLYRKYYKDIKVDVSDLINVLFGSAVHKILEDNTDEPDVEKEIKMEFNFNGITIVGKFDRRNLKKQLIEDYKTGKVSTVTSNDFEEYRLQGLIYSWMTFKLTGVIIRKLRFYILLKDYSKIKASNISNYPSSPIYVWEYDVEDSDYDYIEKYLNNKISLLNKNDISECSDEERWYTGTKYAVYKNVGDKRAAIVCDTEEEAHGYITNKCDGKGEIQVRKGEYLKCKHYCNCCEFCEQWRKEVDNNAI